jgi:predicted ATP-binding protein involved in virulence
MGFFIKSIYYDHKDIDFLTSEYNCFKNNFTILIGKNGTGKSRLLSTIVKTLCSIQVGNKLLKREFNNFFSFESNETHNEINILNNNSFYRITIDGRTIKTNNVYPNKKHDNLLPSNIISVSTSPFDKFPEENDYYSPKNKSLTNYFYSYYGLKNNFKTNPVRVLIEKILFRSSPTEKSRKKNSFINVLNYLGYKPLITAKFRLKYSIKNLNKILVESSSEEFLEFIFTSSTYNPKSFFKDHESAYLEIKEAIHSLQKLLINIENDRHLIITIDYDKDSVDVQDQSLDKIQILFDIGLISLLDLLLFPKSNYNLSYDNEFFAVSLSNTSSGQQCILLSTLGIASSIADNSLILIDEPEISLHPEWQETYIELLMEVFDDYRGCHFIIATHSPQMISNLKKDNCYITQIESGEVFSANQYIDKSVDFQLAILFDAPGQENEYLKRIAINILSNLSAGNKFDFNNSLELKILERNYHNLSHKDSVKNLIDLIFEARRRLQ